MKIIQLTQGSQDWLKLPAHDAQCFRICGSPGREPLDDTVPVVAIQDREVCHQGYGSHAPWHHHGASGQGCL
jgi:hypothetical protein